MPPPISAQPTQRRCRCENCSVLRGRSRALNAPRVETHRFITWKKRRVRALEVIKPMPTATPTPAATSTTVMTKWNRIRQTGSLGNGTHHQLPASAQLFAALGDRGVGRVEHAAEQDEA